MSGRKIIQIAAIPCGETQSHVNKATYVALCNDGTLWMRILGKDQKWVEVPPIPGAQS